MSLIDVEISNVRVHEKGALRGFFTLIVMSMKICDCRYFISGDKRWFSFPQKEIKKPDGAKSEFIPIVSCLNRDFKAALDEIVLDKLSEAFKGAQGNEVQANTRAQNPVQTNASGLPF